MISTPELERDLIIYGKALSTDRQRVFLHSAYIHDGSSGSVVFNDQMEIVGINIVSSTYSLTNKYRDGGTVPVTIVKEVINRWKAETQNRR